MTEPNECRIGFYGGKFMPFHIGHAYCALKALQKCDVLYLTVFLNGEQDEEIRRNANKCRLPEEFLKPMRRYIQIFRFAKLYNCMHKDKKIVPLDIDIKNCRRADGHENMNAETPLVINAISTENERRNLRTGVYNQGKPFDYVFGSETVYSAYFKDAYPFAQHILIDTERKAIPISTTKIRNMTKEEAKLYISFTVETIKQLERK